MFKFDFLKSKTVWGAIVAVIGFITQPAILGVLPEKVSGIILAIGALVTAIGARDAIAKNGSRE